MPMEFEGNGFSFFADVAPHVVLESAYTCILGITSFGKVCGRKLAKPQSFDTTKRKEYDDTMKFEGQSPQDVLERNLNQDPKSLLRRAPSDHSDEICDNPIFEARDISFPFSHEAKLKEHTKVISALALDPSGSRVLSGSHDYDVKLWDFGGMNTQSRSFKSWEPAGPCYVNDLKYSHDGKRFLVISGTTQAKLFDRDGEEQATYAKGDMYIRDMKRTLGHVFELSSCAWHPKDSQHFITSSADSTIRLWDVENRRKQMDVIVVKSRQRGARSKVVTCAYSPDGGLISGACTDGALHLWQSSSSFVRPNLTLEEAHTKGTETGSITFSVDGWSIVTRGGDDTVKLWDLRSFKQAIVTRTGLTSLYPGTNAVFSPDEKYILTGKGADSKFGSGKLVFLRRENLQIEKEVGMESNPVKVQWHPKINQIITGEANGTISVLYSPSTSINGAKLLFAKGLLKQATVEDMSDMLASPSIITPHALPMFREGDGMTKGGKRKREKERMDPRKSRRPELPVMGPGRGGRVGASATQHVVQSLVRDTTRDQDPREALLKYAKLAEEDPQWTTAWQDNQLKPFIPKQQFSHKIRDTASRYNQSSFTGMNTTTENRDLIPTVEVKLLKSLNTDARRISTSSELETMVASDSCPQNHDATMDLQKSDTFCTELPQDSNFVVVDEATDITNQGNGATDVQNDADCATVDRLSTPGNSCSHSIAVSRPHARVDDSTLSRYGVQESDYVDEETKPPPAKRVRMFSENIPNASLLESDSPPTAIASIHMNDEAAGLSFKPRVHESSISVAQYRFCLSTIRSLKKLKDSGPFLLPVDPVVLNIPHYPSIIKKPMDLATIERKLLSSNPAKLDPDPHPRYLTAEDFILDVRLVFNNCVTFNGPDHAISQMGRRVEAVFDKQIKQLPPQAESKPFVKRATTPPAALKKMLPVRRTSTSIPVIRRSDTDQAVGRPKREIHPPPPKDLPYADAPKKIRRTKGLKNDGTTEQLKFCGKLLQDLYRKQHWTFAHPFYEPVDWIKLDIPTYPKTIKKPMDMSTMRKKLENHDYSNAFKFFDDFKLMIRNCFQFNPSGTPVNQAGIELQRLFDEKWKGLPPLREMSEDLEEEEDPDDSEDERAPGAIAAMESQIETMRGNLAALKGSKPVKEKKKKEKRERASTGSHSKPSYIRPVKGSTHGNVSTKRKGKKQLHEDDTLTFDQKKDLSEAIQKLDGTKLEKVIQIIHDGVPEIRDSTEEIELEIDLLPVNVLTKLYNFVLRPLKQQATKRSRAGKGTGTGGLKRKSMDEDVEAEKIRQLEERMRLFEQGTSNVGDLGGIGGGRRHDDSEHSSDSSSGSESSGSDSE
ncbi:hypothetical protein SERLA73DRAFT_68025 [Serpula lacrymans var. lacrymans S7.3]|uniref:Uncharacterized protein n=2 Tax=Serpula lacrymans var. lacrymans TaxID=341189 RepID=F8PG81_SERL3|nr:uncharacterized protein SERLADRAFT_431732 [Serpula lacrymans var. lacrymans S7.9]EGO04328.1 hypothetical protein SERLA73DRAFT_68025 [Serpula lacrymans var. lacrymans S7.3]EGO30245.1 hypothetical protein SERLADRAFT_431732 [Serpula lacrymans var. lacrymans S7.9]